MGNMSDYEKMEEECFDDDYDPDEHLDEWINRMYQEPRVWMNQEQKKADTLRQLNDETWTRMSGR